MVTAVRPALETGSAASDDVAPGSHVLAALTSFLVPLHRAVGPDLKAATVLMAVALLSLGPAPECCTAHDLAATTGLSAAVISRRIRKLRSLGLIERRRNAYRLSTSGQRALQLVSRKAASMLLSL